MNEEKLRFFLNVIFAHLHSVGRQSVTLSLKEHTFEGEIFATIPDEANRTTTIATYGLDDNTIEDVWSSFRYLIEGSAHRPCTHLPTRGAETSILWRLVKKE